MIQAGTNADRKAGISGPLLILAAFLALLFTVHSILLGNRGRVISNGKPVAGAWVSPPMQAARAVRTDSAGRFSIHSLHSPATKPWIVAQDGFFLERVRDQMVELEPLPQDHPETPWIDPTPGQSPRACGDCHQQTHRDWAMSAHGHSADSKLFRWATGPPKTKDPTWNLRARHPDALGACVACHSPGQSSLLAELPGEGPLAGVHCDFCHKIKSLAKGSLGLTHGRDMFQMARPALDGRPVVLGSLKDSTRENVAYSPLYQQSQFCAPCHEGTVLGAKVYSTFSEWTTWGGERSCQDCHMRPVANREHDHLMQASRARDGAGLRHQLQITRNPKGAQVSLSLWTEKVGHLLPTGHVDRHVVGWLEALDAAGNKIPLVTLDQTLPLWATGLDHPVPGFLLARWQQIQGQSPRPFWEPGGSWTDTRLAPGKTRTFSWALPPQTAKVRLRVEHRKAWPEASRENHEEPVGELLINEIHPIP